MINRLHAKSIKVTFVVLAVALILACFLPKQPVFADAFSQAGDRTLLLSVGNGVSGLIEMSDRTRSSIRFMVTYHPNGGVGQTKEEYVDINTEYSIKNQGYTDKKYIFVGWNTRPDGLGLSYIVGQVINVTQNIELYAMWSQKI